MKHLTNLFLVFSFFAICTALHAANEVKLNTNLVVESDGTLRADGDATIWNDLNVFPDATTKTGSNPPVMKKFMSNASSQGVFLNSFSNTTEQELYFTIQLPHGYKEGTTLKPHVHWTTFPDYTFPTGKVIEWGLEYTIMKHNGTFGTTAFVYGSTPVNAPTASAQHTITPLGDIASGTAPNNFTISTVIVCRLFRRISGVDTYDASGESIGLLSMDFHYESDMPGSRTDYTK